jgi:hypothetical protein
MLDKKAPLLLLKELLHNITTCVVITCCYNFGGIFAVIILYAHPVPIIAYVLICLEGALLIRVKELS